MFLALDEKYRLGIIVINTPPVVPSRFVPCRCESGILTPRCKVFVRALLVIKLMKWAKISYIEHLRRSFYFLIKALPTACTSRAFELFGHHRYGAEGRENSECNISGNTSQLLRLVMSCSSYPISM